MPKDFGKNLAKSFKYGVIDTFLEKTAPDIKDAFSSNKDNIKDSFENSKLKSLSKNDVKNMLKNQSTEIKKNVKDVKKNMLDDIKSGNWFGNKERSDKAMMKALFGDDEELAALLDGDDDFLDSLGDDFDLDEDSTTFKSSESSGDIDFNFENNNETNFTDNRTHVNNITSIQNKVDGKLLASVTNQLVNSMSTVSTQIKQISQFHLDETRSYYTNSLSLLTEINETLKSVYTLQTPKSKSSILNEVFSGDTIDLIAYGKKMSKGIMDGLLDKDMIDMVKMFGSAMLADPMKAISEELIERALPKAVKKGMEDLNSNFTNTVKTIVMQLSEGKNGKGTFLQSVLGSFFGLDLSNSKSKAKFENKVMSFDSETKRAIVDTIPELLSRIYGAITKGIGIGSGKISDEDRILRVDYNTGKLTYDANKKEKKRNKDLADKLVGEYYDYDLSTMSNEGKAKQKEIDKLNKDIGELKKSRKNFLDVSKDDEIFAKEKSIRELEKQISKEDKDKRKEFRKTRDEDYYRLSEHIYKYSQSAAAKRGLSPAAIKTITANEFDRRKNGGFTSDKELDEMINELSPEDQKVFASMIRSIESNNKGNEEIKNLSIKDAWSNSKKSNLNEKGKLGFKGLIKTMSDFTNTMATQAFKSLNAGVSDIMFGNTNGFGKNIKDKVTNKVGGWAKENKDKGGVRGWVGTKTNNFLERLKLRKKDNEEKISENTSRSAKAVEKLVKIGDEVIDTIHSDDCFPIRFGKSARKILEGIATKLDVAIETTDENGNVVVDEEGNPVPLPSKDIRKGIRKTISDKIKGKLISNKMREKGITEETRITRLLHLRAKEFVSPITSAIKQTFFSDDENSLKSQLNYYLFEDEKASILAHIKYFFFGQKDINGKKIKGNLLERLSADFINYLKNPGEDKNGKKVDSFLDQWKHIGVVFTDELRALSRKLLKSIWNGLKAYYKLLYNLTIKSIGMINSFRNWWRIRRSKKPKKYSFGTEMGKRVMAVTGFVNNRAISREKQQLVRIGGKVNKDGSYDFTNVDREELAKYKGLAKLAEKQGIKVASKDTNIIKTAITNFQTNAIKAINAVPYGIARALHDLERVKVKNRTEMASYKKEAKRLADEKGLIAKGKTDFKGKKARKDFINEYSNTRFDLRHAKKTKYTKNTDAKEGSAIYEARKAFDTELSAAKKAKEEKEAKNAQKRTADATEKQVKQTAKIEGEKSNKVKKILSYVAMGFLLFKGATGTVTTIIKGIGLGIKSIVTVMKWGFNIVAAPLKALNWMTKGVAGKLLTSGALSVLLYTYLASKVYNGYRGAKNAIKNVRNFNGNLKSRVVGGKVIDIESGGEQEVKGLVPWVGEKISGLKNRIDDRESKKRMKLWREAKEYASIMDDKDSSNQAIIAKKYFDANYKEGLLFKTTNKVKKIKDNVFSRFSKVKEFFDGLPAEDIVKEATDAAVAQGLDPKSAEGIIFIHNYIKNIRDKQKLHLKLDAKNKKGILGRIKSIYDIIKRKKSVEELTTEAISILKERGIDPSSTEGMQFIHNYIKQNSGKRGAFNRLINPVKESISEKISKLRLISAKKQIAEEEANTRTKNALDMKQKLSELKLKATGALNSFKKTQLYENAKILKDKAVDGAGRLIEIVGKGIRGIGTAVQAIPFAGKAIAAAVGAAGLVAITALISKKLKEANSDKIESSSEDSKAILASVKNAGNNKENKKEEKRANKLAEKKEKIKAVIESDEFSRMGIAKKAYWKYQAKKYGVSMNAVTTSKANSAINKLTAMNSGNLVSQTNYVVGQEKDGLIWIGSKWVSKTSLNIGYKLGKMTWNGERFVTVSKYNDDKESKVWWETVMTTGLFGESFDRSSTKGGSLFSKLKNFASKAVNTVKNTFSKNNSEENANNNNNGSSNYANGSLNSTIAGLIGANEGNYESINANDNGSLSIGKLQWHASRAKALLQRIKNTMNSSAYNAIAGGSNVDKMLSNNGDWSSYVPDKTDQSIIRSLLSSNEGINAQEQTINEDVQSYVNTARSYGLTDMKSIAYISDMMNQYGTNSKTVKNIATTAVNNGGSLQSVFNATKAVVGDSYSNRRTNTFMSLNNMASISSESEGLPTVSYGSNTDNVNGFPYYSQGDSRWASVSYSRSGDPSQTIKSSGCGPTSMAMVLKSYGNNVTPVDTAAFSVKNGFRTANSGTSWGFFPAISSQYGLTANNIGNSIIAADSYLDKGIPIIASGNGSEPFTKGGHYVVLSGKDSNGNIIVNDPVSKNRSKKYSKSALAKKIKNMWAFSKNGKGSIKGGSSSSSSIALKNIDQPLLSDTYPTASSSSAMSTGYSSVSSSVSSAVTNSASASVSSSSNGYSDILTKLTTISTILSNIATYDQDTATSIKKFLENDSSINNNTTNATTNTNNNTKNTVITNGDNNDFFTSSSSSNYLKDKYGNISSVYSKFLRPTTISLAKGN